MKSKGNKYEHEVKMKHTPMPLEEINKHLSGDGIMIIKDAGGNLSQAPFHVDFPNLPFLIEPAE